MSDNPRKALEALLRDKLPATWRIRADEKLVSGETTLNLSLRKIRRIGKTQTHELEYEATLRVANEDIALAEDRLDDELLAFTFVLDDLGIRWGEFTKAIYDDRYGYQAVLTLEANREA